MPRNLKQVYTRRSCTCAPTGVIEIPISGVFKESHPVTHAGRRARTRQRDRDSRALFSVRLAPSRIASPIAMTDRETAHFPRLRALKTDDFRASTQRTSLLRAQRARGVRSDAATSRFVTIIDRRGDDRGEVSLQLGNSAREQNKKKKKKEGRGEQCKLMLIRLNLISASVTNRFSKRAWQ